MTDDPETGRSNCSVNPTHQPSVRDRWDPTPPFSPRGLSVAFSHTYTHTLSVMKGREDREDRNMRGDETRDLLEKEGKSVDSNKSELFRYVLIKLQTNLVSA